MHRITLHWHCCRLKGAPVTLPVQAQTQYMEAVTRFGSLKEETDALLAERDEAYLELLAVPSPRSVSGSLLARSGSSTSAAAAEDGGHLQAGAGMGQRKGLLSGFFSKKQ